MANRLSWWEHILHDTVIILGNVIQQPTETFLNFSDLILLNSCWHYIFNTDRQYSGIHSQISKTDQTKNVFILRSCSVSLWGCSLRYFNNAFTHNCPTRQWQLKGQPTGLPASTAILLIKDFPVLKREKKKKKSGLFILIFKKTSVYLKLWTQTKQLHEQG